MNQTTLVLRLNRRAIGAVVLKDEDLTFFDGRHLASDRGRAVAAADRYVTRLLDLTKPTDVLVEAPTEPASTTASILETVFRAAEAAGVRAQIVGTADILHSFGVPALRTRGQLRQIVSEFWPQLNALTGKVKPFVLDAAAATLYAQAERALSPPPP
jgi:hypothetical protein